MNQHRLQIASAVANNGGGSHPRLNSKVLTSFKMGQILPVFHRECVPGDRFRVNIGSFSRFLPMPAPAYVDLTYRTMSVFVPYHQVMSGAESYFANQTRYKGVVNHLPKITNSTICNAFMMTSWGLTTSILRSEVPANQLHKYYLTSGGQTGTVAYKPTALGNYCEKVLHMLGLRYPRRADVSASYDALPLLAFAHAYNCYLSYSATFNNSQLSNVLEGIMRQPHDLDVEEFSYIMTSILLTYEESFFSTLWSQPYSSQHNSSFDANQRGVYDEDSWVEHNGSENEILIHSENGVSVSPIGEDGLTAQQIRLVMKFDDYFRRNNYAGSKDIEQIYSRFGVRIDDYRTRYPYFLSESSRRVNIGDVMSHSDTDVTSRVGSYAGKAIMSDDAGFTFDCKDYGMLFTFAWFAPRPLYADGIDKEWLRVDPFDFYTPELDQGFAAPVDRRQICAGDKTLSLRQGTLGYTRLYSEYLWPYDIVAGDFERFDEFAAWHFARDTDQLASAQSDSLIYIPAGGTEFERIFNVESTEQVDADSIYYIADVNVQAYRPMKDNSAKAALGEGNLDLPENGSQMN